MSAQKNEERRHAKGVEVDQAVDHNPAVPDSSDAIRLVYGLLVPSISFMCANGKFNAFGKNTENQIYNNPKAPRFFY